MFINSLLYLVIQVVVKESKAKENNAGKRRFIFLSIDKLYVSQVIHFNGRQRQANIFSTIGYYHGNKGQKTEHFKYCTLQRKMSLLSNFRHMHCFYIMLLICLQPYVIFIFRIRGEKL